MLELEKECFKDYRKRKKDLKYYNQKVNSNETKFYKIFYYIINEYYYNLQKEFTDEMIIDKCNISTEILNEIKEFLKNKNVAVVKEDKILITYETVIFLDNLINNYKNYYLNTPINIIALFLAILSLTKSIINDKSTDIIIIIGIIILMLMLINIKKSKINKISEYK